MDINLAIQEVLVYSILLLAILATLRNLAGIFAGGSKPEPPGKGCRGCSSCLAD